MAQLAGQRHALVTSETRDLAKARTRAARVRTPAVAVTAEDVTLGKPRRGFRMSDGGRWWPKPRPCRHQSNLTTTPQLDS